MQVTVEEWQKMKGVSRDWNLTGQESKSGLHQAPRVNFWMVIGEALTKLYTPLGVTSQMGIESNMWGLPRANHVWT